MNTTLDQQRAEYAWDRAEAAAEAHKIGEYTNLAKSVANLIMGSGLMQTLAFLQSKSESHHKMLVEDLTKWLGKVFGGRSTKGSNCFPNEKDADFRSVMEALYNSSSELYMQATSETMALLRWVRQFSDAKKSMEKIS